MKAIVGCLLLCAAEAFAPSFSTRGTSSLEMISRRDAVISASSLVASVASVPAANAISACPPNSNNCVRASWSPPSSTSASDAANELRDALNSYPQGGQEGGKVDGGGYSFVSDKDGNFVLEYKSGLGFFAKAFNGGKPFVDDLVIEPNGSAFEVRSSSRVGDSDLGVNGKRLAYIGNILKEKGWSI
ncbi:hypothetical protein THAOC_21568 [Thalassiosira oceanica]|uniref:Uncharacterized protein n=1 Tax=Thalassiosira oceanica TaxID=159749 RepID=K0SIJ1_THAOC|nr:hypothetical protein THAOC_21568 [Thalassiosira oceanica]|eukprot:EJK58322.1 hypothetical protein THAOC_21568 [Thalassiosira oceanica]